MPLYTFASFTQGEHLGPFPNSLFDIQFSEDGLVLFLLFGLKTRLVLLPRRCSWSRWVWVPVWFDPFAIINRFYGTLPSL